MNNLVLFCKSYRDDIDRLAILKDSVDKFNADKIPFYIVVPESDLKLFEDRLVTKNETYELHFITDEQVLKKKVTQSWKSQQLVKLCFYKLNVCNFYSIIDSDNYFINYFHVRDFLFDEKTSFISYWEENTQFLDRRRIKDLIKRDGCYLDFIAHGQVFSRFVLQDMEDNFLGKTYVKINQNGFIFNKKLLNWNDLIEYSPWEFIWYGEWFLKSNIHNIHKQNPKIYTIWDENQYLQHKQNGDTVDDFIKQGYIGLGIQSKYCKNYLY